MTLIIAEAGVNHNGDAKTALQLVKAAHEAGADIIKFQTFIADQLVTSNAKRAKYQIRNVGREESQVQMLRRLELSFELHHQINSECNALGIEFLSTAFDVESLRFLTEEIGLKRLKIASGEITNAPFVLAHARLELNIMLSTGMATLSDIENSLGVIAFGLTAGKNTVPNSTNFLKAYSSDAGQQALKEKVTLLHCTTEYPTPPNEVNLNLIDTLSSSFDLPIGFSDHSIGNEITIAAVAKGAAVIEKHFTLDKDSDGPDHKASLDPQELTEMVKSIRKIELSLGKKVKFPTVSEFENRSVVRKSLVSAQRIKKGEHFSDLNIAIKRPGNGISPYNYWDFIGRISTKDYEIGELVLEP